MISNETRVVIDQAKAIYERYREALEAEHRDQFVAIEPVSGDRFVADSFNAQSGRLGQRIRHDCRTRFELATMLSFTLD